MPLIQSSITQFAAAIEMVLINTDLLQVAIAFFAVGCKSAQKLEKFAEYRPLERGEWERDRSTPGLVSFDSFERLNLSA